MSDVPVVNNCDQSNCYEHMPPPPPYTLLHTTKSLPTHQEGYPSYLQPTTPQVVCVPESVLERLQKVTGWIILKSICYKWLSWSIYRTRHDEIEDSRSSKQSGLTASSSGGGWHRVVAARSDHPEDMGSLSRAQIELSQLISCMESATFISSLSSITSRPVERNLRMVLSRTGLRCSSPSSLTSGHSLSLGDDVGIFLNESLIRRYFCRGEGKQNEVEFSLEVLESKKNWLK